MIRPIKSVFGFALPELYRRREQSQRSKSQRYKVGEATEVWRASRLIQHTADADIVGFGHQALKWCEHYFIDMGSVGELTRVYSSSGLGSGVMMSFRWNSASHWYAMKVHLSISYTDQLHLSDVSGSADDKLTTC